MSARSIGRAAFTLVEMLIAMALTLILVYAIAEFYAYLGDSVKDGRAMIELSTALRGATQRLKTDLDHLTCKVEPWNEDGNASGYFEIVEGLASDSDPEGDGFDTDTDNIADVAQDSNADNIGDFFTSGGSNLLGDTDDVIAFTIRTSGEPLTGRYSGSLLASDKAEVIWFTGYTEVNGTTGWQPGETRVLYRRQLLIEPGLGQVVAVDYPDFPTAHQALLTFWQSNDVSASIRQGTNSSGGTVFRIIANSLSDLTRRDRRFARLMAGRTDGTTATNSFRFPHPIQINPQDGGTLTPYVLQAADLGEDVVQTNLLSFDVRVFDPGAPIYLDADDSSAATARTALQPGDPRWGAAASTGTGYSPVGAGAYVDLFYNRYATGTIASQFSATPAAGSQLAALPAVGSLLVYDPRSTWCTWARSYERDGFGQNGGSLIDEGTDGLDNDGTNGVDDPGERETSPPYPHPLRGIQVKIRVYEPSSRQMRQATVGQDFIPE